ncbi:MAG TPA: type I-F CRISPR-associated protein Csy2 [Burkholderiaceae bacterium]|nr:type I-F CRISPR-associated protein Csy2 [Burkholderiaceae bacterium]
MKAVLILRHVKVENATAITGLTYGFPSMSAFLGYTHALSRILQSQHGLSLGGCGVVCHSHNLQAYRPSPWADYRFTMTRNPLTKEGSTPSFVEEGRMHMDVSLVIECDFNADRVDFGAGEITHDVVLLEEYVLGLAQTRRLAGGTIQSIGSVDFVELRGDDASNNIRKQLLRLLPGFALVDRSELLHEHYRHLIQQAPNAELLDAWLDFIAIKHQARVDPQGGHSDEDGTTTDGDCEWDIVPKPANGYLVPMAMGFKAISPLYAPGQVVGSRDPNIPFRFVEAAYGIGQWISPHRLTGINDLIWRFHVEDDWYICKNSYQPVAS